MMNDHKIKHIAVAGNIGVGKTTLVTKLAHHYGWKPKFEAVDNNPYLADFYGNMTQWAFNLQIYFLNSRFNHILDLKEETGTIIQDRTIYEDAFIFAKNLRDSGHLSARDYDTYFELFQTMVRTVSPPDLLIYLRADISKLTGQISKRGREYENTISIKYLEDLNRYYEQWIAEYQEGNLLILDANKLDYVSNPDDLGFVINKIDGELFGLF